MIKTKYPTTKPSLNLDFANTKSLDPRITFRRGTPGTYYDGVTYAKAEENLLIYSEDISEWESVVRLELTANETAPDGSSTAYKIAQASGETNAGGASRLVNMNKGENYTYSIYAKAGTNRDYLTVRIYDYSISDHYQYFLFDLGNGQTLDNGIKRSDYYGGTHDIQDVGNGWYRCIVSFPVVNDSSGGFLISNFLLDAPASSTVAVADDGGFIYLWGAQLEQRDSVTAYTATNGAPITKYQPKLMTASPDDARFDHDPITGESKGLLIEEQRTNLVQYSEDVSGQRWSQAINFELNAICAPDGTISADRIYQTDAVNNQSRDANIDLVDGLDYVYSVYAKNYNLGYLRINIAGGAGIRYNLIDGTATTDGTPNSIVSAFSGDIEFVGNGWYRCIYKFTSSYTGATSARNVVIDTNTAVQGDGKSGVYIWGAQFETGSFPTSYIKTTGVAVTRSADNASITGENFSSWYRQDEGTLYLSSEVHESRTASTYEILNLYKDSSNYIAISSTGRELISSSKSNGSMQMQLYSYNEYKSQIPYTINSSLGYKKDSVSSFNKGQQVGAEDTSAQIPSEIDKLFIGNRSGSYWSGKLYIKKLAYYPQRLTNEQLQNLTK